MTSMTTADGWGYGVDHEPRTRSEHQLKNEREELVSSRTPIFAEIMGVMVSPAGEWGTRGHGYYAEWAKQVSRDNEDIMGSKDISWISYLSTWIYWRDVEYCDEDGTVWGTYLDDMPIDLSHPLVQEYLKNHA